MGGFGSGYKINPKQVVEDSIKLDIRQLKKCGHLDDGCATILSWQYMGKTTSQIRYYFEGNEITLKYNYRSNNSEWVKVGTSIMLSETPCYFGGSRYWFICPQCKKRVGTLHPNSNLFSCRKCSRLAYVSQRSSVTERLYIKKHKLGRRIYEDYSNGNCCIKKKGMHYQTFLKLQQKYKSVEYLINRSIIEDFESLYK